MHTPSRPNTMENVTGRYPSALWSQQQTAFVIAQLINLRDAKGSAASKREQVQLEWCKKAMNANDGEFSIDKIPSVQEITRFSEEQGQTYTMLSLSNLVQGEIKIKVETKPKNYVLFHSNDAKKSDPNYLKFPLHDADKTTGTTANGITNRRMMAYSVALGVKGKRNKRRQTLQAFIVTAKGAGIERPTDTFDWNTWEYQSYT